MRAFATRHVCCVVWGLQVGLPVNLKARIKAYFDFVWVSLLLHMLLCCGPCVLFLL